MQLSLSAAILSSVRCEAEDSNAMPSCIRCCLNLSASTLNSISSGLLTSEVTDRLSRGNCMFFAGVMHVPSWKLLDELEYLSKNEGEQAFIEMVVAEEF